MIPPDEPRKVSRFYRVLAWIFVGCTALVVVVLTIKLVSGARVTWPMSRAETVFALLGLLLCVPLFGYVAFTGRPPRWWSSIDEMLDVEKTFKRHSERRGKR